MSLCTSENKLVSILLPTYNRPFFFVRALRSALEQTYSPIEIVICDNSTNSETEAALNTVMQQESMKSQKREVRYYKNNPTIDGLSNWRKCLYLSKGEYVNFLFDDDIFRHDKIEKMIKFFDDDSVTCVTSSRYCINEKEEFHSDILHLGKLINHDAILDGISVMDSCLRDTINYIGEPTTVLFKKSSLDVPMGVFGKREYWGNPDMAMWGSLLKNGKIGYINESLSYFRVHQGQDRNTRWFFNAVGDWLHQCRIATDFNFLVNDDDFAICANRCLLMAYNAINRIPQERIGRSSEYLEMMGQLHMLLDLHSYRFGANKK